MGEGMQKVLISLVFLIGGGVWYAGKSAWDDPPLEQKDGRYYAACVAAVLVTVVGLGVVAHVDNHQEGEIQARGEPLIGWIVQANSLLYRAGGGDEPAQVLISFPGSYQASEEQLEELAGRVARLKRAAPADAVEQAVSKLVRDERYRPGARDLLPREFAGRVMVYSVDVMIKRSLLPQGRITLPYIHCKAIPGAQGGRVVMVPYPRKLV